ncbi:Hypothetical protein DEACI_1146 [Acididesulfobacillus acetoxydans]|uniref:Uncharacterized protein n=1 Tax=Acididesulfobacillus acetoxydans TaxID=1561005 RepID=A0A8S0VW65_9FIRM|nr:hypothetical protein [Acididesulfobacillus acetoxydans]CAA7600493.1 Hypothetical protein DEACI_1146 [Acididesulfobacillus acetoxydans]CEJ06627.1 Hypothetical protein DEACI_1076 [Acididesulfobacillus acetoxydans]
MTFTRKVENSDVLAHIIDIPESLRNRKVDILIHPYEDVNTEGGMEQKTKRARGVLEKYKCKDLQDLESSAWAKAMIDKYENS